MGHYNDPRLRAFNINVEDEGERHVILNDNGEEASCKFSFKTSATAIDPTQPAAVVKKVDLSAVLRTLEGTCVSRGIDYWTFEICFGGQIKQSHGGDVYILARQGQLAGRTQMYDGGDECSALPNKPARRVKVEFSCDKSANAPSIVTLTEPKTCEYTMMIATQHVCGDPVYPVITASAEGEAVDNRNEDWLLELVHLDDGRLMCTAYTTEHRATGSRLSFQSFDLQLTAHKQAVVTSNARDHYVARRPGRVPLGTDEVVYGNGQLKNGPKFGGKLSFLKVTT